ncbi:MAG: hypothetical protein R3F33_17835 [Planctomycetota bacterium]
MFHKRLTFLPLVAAALGGAAFAQGDDCSTATAITGTGSWAFDNTILLDSTFNGGGSCAAGASTINQDGFFQWTVPASGDYQFDTFGSGFDTKLSVHAGIGCAATCVAYNDDSGGLQSMVLLTGLVAGDPYLVQVGGYGTAQGTGTLNIATYVDPCSVDDIYEDNDTCTTPSVIGMGSYANLMTIFGDSDFCEIAIPAGMILTFDETYDPSFDAYKNVYDASCSSIGTAIAGDFTYTTGAAAETIIVEVYQNATSTDPCSPYEFTLSMVPDPCAGVADDAFEDNDDCATATMVADGTYAGLMLFPTDNDYFTFCVPNGATVTVDILFTDANADLDLFLREASSAYCGTGYNGLNELLAYGYSVSDNENATWTNTLGYDATLVAEVDWYAAGTQQCNTYDLVISGSGGCGGGTIGTPFCDPMDANSTGNSTTLVGMMTAPAGSGLHVEISGGVPSEFGYLLVGTGVNDPGIMVPGNIAGRICLNMGGSIARYNVTGGELNSIGQFDASGVFQNLAGTSSVGSGFDVPSTVPIPGNPVIGSGDTYHFQMWHRDTPAGVGQSNFSNGLSVTFP